MWKSPEIDFIIQVIDCVGVQRRLWPVAIKVSSKTETINSTWGTEVAGRETLSSTVLQSQREFYGGYVRERYQKNEWLSTKSRT